MASIYTRIINGELPSDKVYEDDLCVAIRDISPQAPSHILVIPREELPSMMEAEDRHKELLGHLLLVAAEVAKSEGLSKGYRLVINCKEDGCQSVDHLHIHVLGGRQMTWPPG